MTTRERWAGLCPETGLRPGALAPDRCARRELEPARRGGRWDARVGHAGVAVPPGRLPDGVQVRRPGRKLLGRLADRLRRSRAVVRAGRARAGSQRRRDALREAVGAVSARRASSRSRRRLAGRGSGQSRLAHADPADGGQYEAVQRPPGVHRVQRMPRLHVPGRREERGPQHLSASRAGDRPLRAGDPGSGDGGDGDGGGTRVRSGVRRGRCPPRRAVADRGDRCGRDRVRATSAPVDLRSPPQRNRQHARSGGPAPPGAHVSRRRRRAAVSRREPQSWSPRHGRHDDVQSRQRRHRGRRDAREQLRPHASDVLA